MHRIRLACLTLAAVFAASLLVTGCQKSDIMKPDIKPEERAARRDKSGED